MTLSDFMFVPRIRRSLMICYLLAPLMLAAVWAQDRTRMDTPAPVTRVTTTRLARVGNVVSLGGGNILNGEMNEEALRRLDTLQALGMTVCRVNLYPDHYLIDENWDKPRATALDALMDAAWRRGITPVILFEYYSDYYPEIGLGSYAQWRHLGGAFATRYAPGGDWGREHGVTEWGVTVFTAVNEPDLGEFRQGGKYGPAKYVEALRGLAAGVHDVSAGLRVAPGGFATANSHSDWTLRGLAPALAPLFNAGALSGLDLHTYYDVQWAPIRGTRRHSAQYGFAQVKKAAGITADIEFYCTEFNFKKREVSEPEAAAGFFTGFWDHLGVTGNDNATPVTRFVMAWNIFHTAAEDEHYGLQLGSPDLAPTPRGETLTRLAALTKGLRLVTADPADKGEYTLESDGRKLWVWQNRAGWTDHAGATHTLTGIPASVTQIEMHAWDGLRRVLTINEQTTLTIRDLPREETLVFLAR
ncbi:MAG: hypothetical protein ACKV2V_06245 [Blastocatellia bacterium]